MLRKGFLKQHSQVTILKKFFLQILFFYFHLGIFLKRRDVSTQMPWRFKKTSARILFLRRGILLPTFFLKLSRCHTLHLLEGRTEVAWITESYFVRNFIDAQIRCGE